MEVSPLRFPSASETPDLEPKKANNPETLKGRLKKKNNMSPKKICSLLPKHCVLIIRAMGKHTTRLGQACVCETDTI